MPLYSWALPAATAADRRVTSGRCSGAVSGIGLACCSAPRPAVSAQLRGAGRRAGRAEPSRARVPRADARRHPDRRGRRRGRRTTPDRAGPARRRAAAAGRVGDEPRPGPLAAGRRSGRCRGAGRRGARGREAGARRAAGPGPGDPPGGATDRGLDAALSGGGGAVAGAGTGRRRCSGCPGTGSRRDGGGGVLRRQRGARERRQAQRRHHGGGRGSTRPPPTGSSSPSPTTGTAVRSERPGPGGGLAGVAAGRQHVASPPGGRTVAVRSAVQCGRCGSQRPVSRGDVTCAP